MRDKKQKTIEWFSKWSETYDRFIFRFWMLHMIRKVLNEAGLSARSNILDVGCGTGDALIEAAKVASSGKLCGVDLSEEMLKKAREKLRSFRNASLFNKDILDFSSEEQFDAVVSTEAFHHFVEPERSIKAMAKLLKKGGRLVVGDIHFRPLFLFNFLWKLEPGFVKMYSHGKFRKMFADAGLKVVKQKRVFVVGLMTVGEKS